MRDIIVTSIIVREAQNCDMRHKVTAVSAPSFIISPS